MNMQTVNRKPKWDGEDRGERNMNANSFNCWQQPNNSNNNSNNSIQEFGNALNNIFFCLRLLLLSFSQPFIHLNSSFYYKFPSYSKFIVFVALFIFHFSMQLLEQNTPTKTHKFIALAKKKRRKRIKAIIEENLKFTAL